MPAHAEDRWVRIGRVGRPFGLKGEVVIHYTGETPDRFQPGRTVQVLTREGRIPAKIATMRPMPGKLVVSFEGRADVDQVRPWVNCPLEVRASELPELEEGSYYHYQLLGIEVYAADGRRLGVVEEILTTAGNDIYCVRDGERELLIPAIADAIESLDPAAGRMVLKDLKGLLEP